MIVWMPIDNTTGYRVGTYNVGTFASNAADAYPVPDDFEAKQAARAQRIKESRLATLYCSDMHGREPATDGGPVWFLVPRPTVRRTATGVRNWRKAA